MKNKYPYALFGNGPKPTHPSVRKRLSLINTFFCVDGGVDKLIEMGYKPDLILGDLDSIDKRKNQYGCDLIFLEDQTKNDLEKSIAWCIDQGIKELELFGFSHGRDDHHLANILIMRDFSLKVKIKMYTNNSLLLFINKNSTFSSNPNQKISIFSFNKETKITTSGLKYSLKNSSLSSASHGISNLATGTSFSVKTSDWILVLIHYYQ